MKPSAHLFHLIKSLSSREKRFYLRQVQKQKGGKDQLYLRLFHEIDKQDHYEEEKLKVAFAGSSFGKSLAFPKSHLYDQVLRTLQRLHHEVQIQGSLRSQLDKIEILVDRGLPAQAWRILQKALKQALNFEQCLEILQLLRWKRRLVLRLQPPAYPEELKAIAGLEKHWQKVFEKEQQAIDLHDHLYALFQETRRKGGLEADPDLEGLLRQLNALKEDTQLHFAARIAALRGSAHLYHMREDFVSVHTAYQEEIQVWEAHPRQIKEAPLRFVRAFGQWLSSKALIRDYEQLLSETQRLRKYPDLGKRGEAEVFQITYNLELFYYLNAGLESKAIALSDTISVGIETYDKMLLPSAKLGFFYNLALVHWLDGKNREALHWTRKILHFEKGEIRKDIRNFAPILEKILHFDLGHISQLESWFRAFAYHKSKKEGSNRLEGVVLRLVKTCLDEEGAASHQKAYEAFLHELKNQAKQRGTSRLGLLELQKWAQRRLASL